MYVENLRARIISGRNYFVKDEKGEKTGELGIMGLVLCLDFKENQPMTKTLTDFFRTHELGDFQKAEFAKELATTIKYTSDLTDEILEIIKEIKKL